MLQTEEIYQLLMNKEWSKITYFLHKHKDAFGKDPILQQAIKLFETEFFSDTDKLSPNERKKAYENPMVIIEMNNHAFSKSFVDTLKDRKLDLLKELGDKEILFNYASQNQDREKAKVVLNEFQKDKPEVIADAVRQNVSIKANDVISGPSRTNSLFKSKQEQYFFEAVRAAFPTYHPYPNVALNSVIDFDGVKDMLSSSERDYFFKGLVDTVVFDSHNNYEPKYFIELDSHFHDSERAKINDRMKDNIFKAANAKLIRIRAYKDTEVSVERFRKLVTEVMRNL